MIQFSYGLSVRIPGHTSGKESTCQARDSGSIPGQEDPLEEGVATHSSILARSIPWTEEPGYSPWGHKRVRHDRSDLIYSFLRGKGSQYMYYKQKEKALFSSISKGSSTRTSVCDESVFTECHLKNTERRKLQILLSPKHPHPIYKYTHFYSTHLLYLHQSDHERTSDGKYGD